MTQTTYNCLQFNQDFSCLCAGSNNALQIFNVDPFGECFEMSDEHGGINVASMLFATSLVTIVGTESPRRLKIINTKKKSTICELTFPTSILSVKLNRKRLVVVLLDQIYLYDISCMKLLHTIETSPNELALCDLSSSDDSILIYPAPGPSIASPFDTNASSITSSTLSVDHKSKCEVGTVVLFDALNIAPLNIIKAHKTDLASLTLNANGTLFATASNKGTIIRCFNTFSGVKVGEFRRGSYSAKVNSLTFDLGSVVVAAVSETGTVHIFKVGNGVHEDVNEDGVNEDEDDAEDEDEDDEENHERILPRQVHSSKEPTLQKQSTHYSITNKFYQQLPKNITSILEPLRDFAWLKLPHTTTKSLKHSIGFNNKDILVASSDGTMSIYQIPSKGGECVLMKQYSL